MSGTDRLTPKDGRWLAVGEWVVEYCAEQPDEPESLFIVHPDVNAATVARLHNDLLDEVARLREALSWTLTSSNLEAIHTATEAALATTP